jgi:hypothetical protein
MKWLTHSYFCCLGSTEMSDFIEKKCCLHSDDNRIVKVPLLK